MIDKTEVKNMIEEIFKIRNNSNYIKPILNEIFSNSNNDFEFCLQIILPIYFVDYKNLNTRKQTFEIDFKNQSFQDNNSNCKLVFNSFEYSNLFLFFNLFNQVKICKYEIELILKNAFTQYIYTIILEKFYEFEFDKIKLLKLDSDINNYDDIIIYSLEKWLYLKFDINKELEKKIENSNLLYIDKKNIISKIQTVNIQIKNVAKLENNALIIDIDSLKNKVINHTDKILYKFKI